MARIIQPADIRRDPAEEVRKLLASLQPGQSVVLKEFLEEKGLSWNQVRNRIPKENLSSAHVAPYHKAVILITCPASSPPRLRTKSK